MNVARYLKIYFCISGLVILGLVAANWMIDPFSVFGTPFLPQPFLPNQRYIKIGYLEENPGKFDSFLFGSSRIAYTDSDLLNHYIRGARFYNFSVGYASLYDHMVHLKYFLKKNCTVKNLYLQIDVDFALQNYQHENSIYFLRYHPHVTGESNITFMYENLTIFPLSFMAKKLKNNLELIRNPDIDILKYDFYGDGGWSAPYKEKEIAKDPEGYVRRQKRFHVKETRAIGDIFLQKNLETLREIKKMCDEHRIRLILFVTPHHHVKMDSIVAEDYYKLLKKLVEISDYWDFSGYNSVTTDDHYYYEESHYRPLVSKLVAARIFKDRKVAVPSDFGVWVTPSNIEAHINDLRNQVIQHDRRMAELKS